MNTAAVADTHAALWYLLDDLRLSDTVRTFIHRAELSRQKIAISSISLVEIAYLVEKRRIPESSYDELTKAMADPEHIFIEAPVNIAVANALRLVSRNEIPDMPDRIIAATGLHLDVPILSRDGRIRAANLKTIW